MKTVFMMGALCGAAIIATDGMCAQNNKQFRGEVMRGLDIISVQTTVQETPAYGELGGEVYETLPAVQSDMRLFIPTTAYVRMGGGMNLNFATDRAKFNGNEYRAADGYTAQIGLGWNLSPIVRTEIDFQTMTLGFLHLDDMDASYQTAGAMLYFDLRQRYVQTGDVTRRRRIVPFIGFGAGVGHYAFSGASDGADGVVLAAPRAVAGVNVMLNDLIGIDIAYQYQMMIGNGFGWDVRGGGTNNISNIMASIRANF